MAGRKRSGTALLVRTGLSVLAFGLLGWALWTSRDSLRQVASRQPDGRFLLLGFLLCLAALALTFVRWHLLVRAQGLPLRLRDALRLGFIGYAVDQIVPGQVGGDVLKATFLCRGQPQKARAIATILIDRAVGLLGLFLLAGLMGGLSWPVAGPPVRRLILVAWGAMAAGGLALVAVLTPALLGPLERLARGRGRSEAIVAELRAMGTAYRDRKIAVLGGLTLATASHGLYALAFHAISRALFAQSPTIAQHLLMVPLVLFTTVVPLPFGALGLSEQVSGQLFRMIGHTDGVVAMMGFRVLGLVVGCLCVLVYLANLQALRVRGEGSRALEIPAEL